MEQHLRIKHFCFAWTKIDGGRESCEIGTAVLQWFKTLLESVKKVFGRVEGRIETDT